MEWHVLFMASVRRMQPTVIRASLLALMIAADPQQLSSETRDIELKVLIKRGFYGVG